MTYEERLTLENKKLEKLILQNKKAVLYNCKVLNDLSSRMLIYPENRLSLVKEISNTVKDIEKDSSSVDSLTKQWKCVHTFKDTDYSNHLDSEGVIMQRCKKCGITIQRKSEGEFSLGIWNEKYSKKQ